MLRTASLIVAFSALVSSQADARLWETVTQAESRYGPSIGRFPGAQGEEERNYKYKDLLVFVTYVAGKSEMEIYMHQDEKKRFSDQEIQLLLDTNSFGKRWEKHPKLPMWYLMESHAKRPSAVAAFYPKVPRVNPPGFAVLTAAYCRKHKIMDI